MNDVLELIKSVVGLLFCTGFFFFFKELKFLVSQWHTFKLYMPPYFLLFNLLSAPPPTLCPLFNNLLMKVPSLSLLIFSASCSSVVQKRRRSLTFFPFFEMLSGVLSDTPVMCDSFWTFRHKIVVN